MLLEGGGFNQVLLKISWQLFKYWLAIWMIALVGCDAKLEDLTRTGTDYYPIRLGSYWVYEMKDTTYLVTGEVVSQYQLREQVIDSVDDPLNDDVVYAIERSVRANDMDRWKVDSIWTVRLSAQHVVRVENNTPYIALSFPIAHNRSWDGNALNRLPIEDYSSQKVLQDSVIHETSYHDLWRVVQADVPADFISKKQVSVLYAKDIGVVQKFHSHWIFCQSECTTTDQIIAGRGYLQTLIAYGQD